MRGLLLALALLAVCATPAAAIVGGKETDRAWPWMVAMEYGRAEVETGPLQQCGGALVAPKWVLTAAHCLESSTGGWHDPRMLAVSIGRHDKDEIGSGERIQVAALYPHDRFDATKLDGYDLALLELAAPAKAPPIRIAGTGEEAAWAGGTAATALGWGFTGFPATTYQDKLKEATLTIDGACALPGLDAETVMCAKAPDASICFGDSGGPLVVPVGAQWRLVGVVAWGYSSPPCEVDRYAGYDRIADGPLREWIAARVPEAFAPAVAAPPPAPAPAPAPAAQPSATQPATPFRMQPPAAKRPSKALRRCLKKARKSKRKQRACRRAEAKRDKTRIRRDCLAARCVDGRHARRGTTRRN